MCYIRQHICAVTYMTEISLHVTLNTNKLKLKHVLQVSIIWRNAWLEVQINEMWKNDWQMDWQNDSKLRVTSQASQVQAWSNM